MITVKVLLVILIIAAPQRSLSASKHENILVHTMAIGQHHEISLPNIKNYSIGNKSIISHNFNKKRSRFIFTGRKIGFTELIFWVNGKKTIYKVYVISNQSHLKRIHFLQSFIALGLNAKILGLQLLVDGHISTDKNYRRFQTVIKKLTKESLSNTFEVTIDKRLIKKYIAEIYLSFYNQGINSVSCSIEHIKIYCRYDKSVILPADFSRYLKSKYIIEFIKRERSHKYPNYLLKLKFILIENLDGNEINFGLDQITTNLGDFFNSPIDSIIRHNNINLRSRNIELSTLARPEIILRLNSTSSISLGSNIPVQQNKDGKNWTDWKFAGLKLKVKLIPSGKNFLIQYSSTLSRPDENGSISGNKAESTISLSLDSPIELFRIGLKALAKSKTNIPYISNLPLLGNLFIGRHDTETFKSIRVIANLEKVYR